MTDSAEKLLRDNVMQALDVLESSAYKPGVDEGFRHINYCQWCHWAESAPHGEGCPITMLRAHLSAHPVTEGDENGGWISVADRLPDENVECLLFCVDGLWIHKEIGYRRRGWAGEFCTNNVGGGAAIQGVTLWQQIQQPLPAAPMTAASVTEETKAR